MESEFLKAVPHELVLKDIKVDLIEVANACQVVLICDEKTVDLKMFELFENRHCLWIDSRENIHKEFRKELQIKSQFQQLQYFLFKYFLTVVYRHFYEQYRRICQMKCIILYWNVKRILFWNLLQLLVNRV